MSPKNKFWWFAAVSIAKGMAFGADAYITKPFSNAQIMKQVKKLLQCN
jgi:DNA-binding response OmpR family regulator